MRGVEFAVSPLQGGNRKEIEVQSYLRFQKASVVAYWKSGPVVIRSTEVQGSARMASGVIRMVVGYPSFRLVGSLKPVEDLNGHPGCLILGFMGYN